jgi:hypothetical protein
VLPAVSRASRPSNEARLGKGKGGYGFTCSR